MNTLNLKYQLLAALCGIIAVPLFVALIWALTVMMHVVVTP